MKLRTRVKLRAFAPGGDLSKLEQFHVVEIFRESSTPGTKGAWALGVDANGQMCFKTAAEAEAKAQELDGLEVDVS